MVTSIEAKARAWQATLTKPPGSLGRLEEIAIRLARIQNTVHPTTYPRVIAVFAGGHGVTDEGVSPYPAEVTRQMVANIESGGAAINALAGVAGADVHVVDTVAIRPATRNFVHEPAMTASEVEDAMALGAETARAHRDAVIVGLGEMGIGNTTSASAITAALTGRPAREVTGRGTGLDDAGLERKIAVVERALARHPDRDPCAILHAMGGLEIAALVGFCVEAARLRTAIVVDGFITTAAFIMARQLEPSITELAFYAHRSVEPGHGALLDALDATTILDLGLRLGEGTGAALAIPVIDAAVAAHNEMATFDGAKVSDRNR